MTARIEPQRVISAINDAIRTTVARIIQEEADEASKRVKERIIAETINLGVAVVERFSHQHMRNDITLAVEINDPAQP